MATPKFTQNTTYKTDHRVKNLFKTAFTELGVVQRAFFGDRPPEMQSVTAALWLWFARMTRDERADWLAREFPKLIAYMEGGELPEITHEAQPPRAVKSGPKKAEGNKTRRKAR